MRLEVGSIAVEGLEFGGQTALDGRTLLVDRDEIRRLVLEDPHFADVDVRLARPGESIRIIHALDVAEPRWKTDGPGGVFPGFVTDPVSAGDGHTRRLAGVAVVEVGEPVPGEPTHFREQIIDMAGPGAPYSPFGQTLNVVLDFRPNLAFFPPDSKAPADVLAGSADAAEYNQAITTAGLKVAARLGQTAADATPDAVEVSELAPGDPSLPRVVCIYQCQRPFLYGTVAQLATATLLHPNECYDGALVGWRQGQRSTYWDQNHAVLQELGRHHGTDLCFLGCILFGDITPYRADKERASSAAARFARLLDAQAAIFLGVNGSNYAVDTMLALEKCEQLGIRTTLVYPDVGNGRDDPGFIFALPAADAIVCSGSRDHAITLAPLDEVIGGGELMHPTQDPHAEVTIPVRYMHSSCSVQGHPRLTTRFH
jgi:sarcosine reductase